MCGRTVFKLSRRRVGRVAGIRDPALVPSSLSNAESFNLSPTNFLVCVTEDNESHSREVELMRWGIEPRFEVTHALTTINARIEGVRTSKMYSPLIDTMRCVVIVDAFYEWTQTTKIHTPFLIRFKDSVSEAPIPLNDDQSAESATDATFKEEDSGSVVPEGVSPLLLAAIFDTSKSGERRCSILTTDSVGPVAKVHTRMPVLLSPETARMWLSSKKFDEIAGPVIKGCKAQANELQCTQVSPLVNSVANKSRDVTLPIAEHKKRSFEKGLGRYFTISPDSKKARGEKEN